MAATAPARGRGADIGIGALAALIYLGEYLGQGAIANKALNTGSVTALATAAFGTLLTLCLSRRRNPMTGPRFLSVVAYASILSYAMALPTVRGGGALLAFAIASLCVSASGLWLILICKFGWEGRVRALMSLPALSALAFIVATTAIAGQFVTLNGCGAFPAWSAMTVAAIVVVCAFAIKYWFGPKSKPGRVRLCVALVVGGAVYFGWRYLAPTPALCGAIGQIHGDRLLDALLGAWRWPAKLLPTLASAEVMLTLLVGSGVLALLCLIDTVSAASTLAGTEGSPDADTSRELLATGLGNLVGGLLGLLPVSLSLSRSRTVAELNPTSGRLPALAHAIVLLLLLVLLVPLHWPLLDYLPKAVIAGALLVVSIEMIDDKCALLWRAGLGADEARTTLATGMWIFVVSLGAAVLCASSSLSKLAVTVGFATAVVCSLLGLLAAGTASTHSQMPLGGHLNFLNIGQRLRRWRKSGSPLIDLSETESLDFSAACALADLASAKDSAHSFGYGPSTGSQVPQVLEIVRSPAAAPSKR